MARSWSILLFLSLQYAFQSCLASPAGRGNYAREAAPQITEQPKLAAASTTAPPDYGCYHAADPDGSQGFCPDIAAAGWCVCSDLSTYAMTSGGDPCPYTTPPAAGPTVIPTTPDCPTAPQQSISGSAVATSGAFSGAVTGGSSTGGLVNGGSGTTAGPSVTGESSAGPPPAPDSSLPGASSTGESSGVTPPSATDSSAPGVSSTGDSSAAPPSVTGSSMPGSSAPGISVTGASSTVPEGSATSVAGSHTDSATTAAPIISIYTIGGIVFTGNPTSLVVGSATLTPGSPPLTSSDHTIAIPASATGGQIQVDGTPTALPAPVQASTTAPAADSGANTGSITGPASNSATNTGTMTAPPSNSASVTASSDLVSQTTYVATNIPSGTPWGVMLTTVSDQTYTLTWTGSQIDQPTTIIETGPSTTETTSQTAGGFIWVLPTTPPGFPGPIPPGPPPGFPPPIGGGGIDPKVPGCLFGCGPPGGGGGGFPCVINCGSGGGGGGGGGGGNPDPTGNPDPSNNPSNEPSNTEPSKTQTSNSQTSSDTITSSQSSSQTSSSGSSSSSSSSSGAAACDALCPDAACAAPTGPAKSRRDAPLNLGRLASPVDYLRDDLAKRGLLSMPSVQLSNGLSRRGLIDSPNSADYDALRRRGFIDTKDGMDYRGNIDQFITEEMTKTGKSQLLNRQTGRFSSALSVAFDSPPNEGEYYPSVSGLEGCTSVVIIGEKGCWISHLWEAPSFKANDATFRDQVIHSLEQGDNGNVNMKSPFAGGNTGNRIPELADGEGGFKPEIYISTPVGDDGTGYKYDARVGEVEQVLVGPGRAFAGITPQRRGYVPLHPPDANKARGKVLIQYTNDQQDEMGERIVCPQAALYRLWFEGNKVADHSWPAAGNQIAAGGANNRKRQANACGPSASSSAVSLTGSATGSAAETDVGTVSPTRSVTGSVSGTEAGSSSTAVITDTAGGTTNAAPISTGPTNTGPITSGPTASATPSQTGPICLHNPVNQDPPNCIEPSSSSQPFKCSAGSNLGVATYDPATWCGCNINSGTLYPTMTTGSGDAACAYTAPPDTTVKPTAIPVDTASINSALTASITSASIASADAAWSSAAAVPSGGCYITGDSGFGDSSFQVYGINDWAGEDGGKLLDELDGCGILDPWEYYPDSQSEFQGRTRKTGTAYFGLSFFKGGCVERAVHAAGGPSPDEDPNKISCEHHNETPPKLRRRRFGRQASNDTFIDEED